MNNASMLSSEILLWISFNNPEHSHEAAVDITEIRMVIQQ
jgi:hypothetical protein